MNISSISKEIQDIIKGRTDNSFHQFARYVVAGAAAMLVDTGALWFLFEIAHFHRILAGSIGFALGALVNYLFSVFWVFSRRKVKNRYLEIISFVIIGLIGVGLNAGILELLNGGLNLHILPAKGISLSIVFFWNFFARKLFLFSKKGKPIWEKKD